MNSKLVNAVKAQMDKKAEIGNIDIQVAIKFNPESKNFVVYMGTKDSSGIKRVLDTTKAIGEMVTDYVDGVLEYESQEA